MAALVSVIIPVYNREDYLEECIASVTAQSHQQMEILIVDDGSTDNSLAICKKLAEQDSRIRLICARHSGVSAARNLALDQATGEYVCFVDSDDVIHPLLLEQLVKAMTENNASIAGANRIDVPEKHWHQVKAHMQKNAAEASVSYQDHQQSLEAMFFTQCPLSIMGGLMLCRSLIGETRFRTDLYIGEDYYFIYENLVKGATSCFLNAKWYYGRQHANNSSWDYSYKGFYNRFIRRKMIWENEEKLGRQQYANAQKNAAFGAYLMCMRKKAATNAEYRQMRLVLKQHKSAILPALKLKTKLYFLMLMYCPVLTNLMINIKK